MFFFDFENNVKKRTYNFTGHLITQTLVLNYRNCSNQSTISTSMDHTPGAGNWITAITERSIWTQILIL